jgi:hypothetical protein
MNVASMLAVNLFETGGTDLGINAHARSKSAGQGECTLVIGSGN